MPPAPHRADKDARVEEVIREPDAVAEDRAFGERAGGIYRDHPDPLVFLAIELYELRDDAALPHPGRSREAHA
jgi:hypothetical protein